MRRSTALLALPLTAALLSAPGGAQTSGPCGAAEYRQFDFWVGEWDVTVGGAPAGTNSVTKTLGDCVIQEHWQGLGGGADSLGQSFNLYYAPERRWHQVYVASNGLMLRLAGGLEDGRMVMSGENALLRQPEVTVLDRITWSVVDGNPDRVRQLWERSSDGGTSFAVVFDGLYQRRR